MGMATRAQLREDNGDHSVPSPMLCQCVAAGTGRNSMPRQKFSSSEESGKASQRPRREDRGRNLFVL